MENIFNQLCKSYINNDFDEYVFIKKISDVRRLNSKEKGAVYTEKYIVDYMIEKCDFNINDKIIEPSCGHGAFLFGLLEYAKQKFGLFSHNLYEWFTDKVIGIDLEEETVSDLKIMLPLYFKKHFDLDNLFFNNIFCTDSLKTEFDKNSICIGNPPYIKIQNLDKEYREFLSKNYISCKKGNIDIYFAFVEKFLESKKLCFIIPNSFLFTKSGKILKTMIEPKLNMLIDFKDKHVFKDIAVYTTIILSGKTNDCFEYGECMERTENISKNVFFGKQKNKNNFEIFSGVTTLADNIYKVYRDEQGYYTLLGKVKYYIEKDLIVPCVKITKKDKEMYFFVPYIDKKIIKENELKEYPLMYQYLLCQKTELLKRDRGKTDKYESWYAFGRKQGLHSIKTEHVVFVPKMVGGNCKPFKMKIADVKKDFDSFVFLSGFCIPESENNKKLYDFVLSENFWKFVFKEGKIMPGKNHNYYEIGARHLKEINIDEYIK